MAAAIGAGGGEGGAGALVAVLWTAIVGWVLMSSSDADGGGGGITPAAVPAVLCNGSPFASSQLWMSAMTSVQLEYRSSRSLASIRAMMPRSSVSTSGLSSRTSGGSTSTMSLRRARGLSARKGMVPVTISKKVTPRE